MTHELKAPKCKKKFDLQLLAKQLPIPIEILDEVVFKNYFSCITEKKLMKTLNLE